MKKITMALCALCAVMLFSCANDAMNRIEKSLNDATEQTKAATTVEEVSAIGLALEAEMQKIAEEAGDGVGFSGDAEKAIEEYQKAALAKLEELGVQIGE